MAVRCPTCTGAKDFREVSRPEYPPLMPQVFGGWLFALVFELSRKHRFLCNQCDKSFRAHTIGSRLWQCLWALFMVWVIVAWTIIFVAGFFAR